MTYLIVLGLYFAILFAVGYIGRRSMGVPALTLAAGALMAELWTDSLTPVVAQAGLAIIQLPLKSIVAVALTLVPALLVMFRSHKASAHHHSIFGSLLFAFLGVALTYGAFSNAVVLDEQSKQYVLQMVKYQNIGITVGIVLAMLDVLLYKKPPEYSKHSKHHAH